VKFRKKPVVIEAVQFLGSLKELCDFIKPREKFEVIMWDEFRNPEQISIVTLEGNHLASIGDWIIKGVKGEFYPCKPDIFEMTYEKLDET
jgi:hypothetical protein